MPLRSALLLIAVSLAAFTRAEEGFWPFDMIPKETLQTKYEFTASDAWLEHAQRSSLKLSSGGSGSFVSPHGLIMTNRHVVSTALQRLSEVGKTDLIRDGLLAKTQADEQRAYGLRAEQLIAIININDRVHAAAERFNGNEERALQAVTFEIERNDREEHQRVQTVKMYPEGEYRLYKYKVFDDLRLVFAADVHSGYFGGDQDNFTYPRYDFDIAFVRAYEDGKPADTPDFFKWSKDGAKENELIFFAGSPGPTERSQTFAHFELTRDKIVPTDIAIHDREAILLRNYAARGAEQAQVIQDRQHHVENTLKRLRGQLDGLREPAIAARKKAEEEAALHSVTDPEKSKAYAGALADMRQAVDKFGRDQVEYQLLGSSWGVYSAQLATAVAIAGMEDNGNVNFRTAEQRERRLEALYLYDSTHRQQSEQKYLEESLAFFAAKLGADHETVKLVLDGKTPAERAKELLAGSKLGSAEFYQNAQNGGFTSIETSGDAMLILAKKIYRRALLLNQRQQREFADVEKKSYAQIARALGLAAASRRSPDGNFTPRLSFGTIRGYTDHGKVLQPFTKLGSLYDLNAKAHNDSPYHLNDMWLAGREKLDSDTPYNFVTDADGYGGSSGSPVFNRNAEIVGILFDGNYPGQVGKYVYDERTKRSICVDSRAIATVLERLYGAHDLVTEFTK